MATIIAIASAAGAVFVYMDGRHRRKKTDSRLWFWVKDLYSKQGLTPPPPPDADSVQLSKEAKAWEGR